MFLLSLVVRTTSQLLLRSNLQFSDQICVKAMADWNNLPTDILLFIIKRVVYMEDFLCLSAVCKSWNSVLPIPALPPRIPRLMLPSETHSGSTARHSFYSLSTSKTHEFELPEAALRKCIGASYGWLVTVTT